MKKKRYNYRADEKVAILKQHLVDHVPVSDICDQYCLQPTVFYRWQKEFFENGAAAFDKEQKNAKNRQSKKIKVLEQKIHQKNEVISELMEDHVKLKKVLGRFERVVGSARYQRQYCGLYQILGKSNGNTGL